MRTIVNIHGDLIEQSKKGDRRAQKSLFDLYSRAIFNIGVRILGNTNDAADVTQDTFVDAFTKLDQFAYRSTFGAWLKQIMVNKSLNFLQQRKIHFDTDEVEEILIEEEDPLDLEEMMIQLNVSLSNLPEGCRIVFTLYHFEGLDHQEIADKLKISVSTSKSQLKRARTLLRELLTEKIVI